VQVRSPLPSAEPELFLLWRSARGQARLVAAPWGFERDDDAAAQRLAVLTTEDSDTQHDASGDASPYPGLAAYGIEDAQRFAKWLFGRPLKGEDSKTEVNVDLPEPVPVYVTYLTAEAGPNGPKFRADPYSRDPALLTRYFGDGQQQVAAFNP